MKLQISIIPLLVVSFFIHVKCDNEPALDGELRNSARQGTSNYLRKLDGNTATIVNVLQNEDDISTLLVAAANTSVATALSGAGPLTLFAPNNDAFGQLDPAVLSKLLTPNFIKHLENLLLFHAVAGCKIKKSDVPQGTTRVKMANNEIVKVANRNGSVTLSYGCGNIVSIDRVDLEASNGVVHVVKSVLLPSFISTTITAKAASLKSFSTLVELIGIGFPNGLPAGDFTVFAPTNNAFASLGNDAINAIKRNSTLVTAILANHVVSGVYPSSIITDGAELKSLGELTITASVTSKGISVNGAKVTAADTLAINGIIHGIDTVL